MPGDPPAGELAAIKRAFNTESEEEAMESKKATAGVLLAESPEGPYAFTKVKGHWRAGQGGHTLAVHAEGPSHKRLEEAAFLEQYKLYTDAIFTVEGSAGRDAGGLMVGDLPTVARPVPPTLGKFSEVIIKIGDNEERSISIEDFISLSNVELKPTAGREAPAATARVRVLDAIIQPDAAEDTVIARSMFVGPTERAVEGYMVQLGMIPAEGDVTAGGPALWLASWMARPELKGVIASGLAEAQDEVEAGAAPSDALKAEAIKYQRYFMDSSKSVLRGLTPDDVEAILAKMADLGPLAKDPATFAALTRAAALAAERGRGQSIEYRIDAGKESPSKMAALYRQRADDIEKRHPKPFNPDPGDGPVAESAFTCLVPATEPDATGKRIVEALGGLPLVKMVATMRERVVVQTTVTDMVVTSFANDFTFLLGIAKRGPRWLLDPKPPFDWDTPAADYNEAVDRFGYVLDMATYSGLPMSIREAGEASTHRGQPAGASRRAAQQAADENSTVWKPPYNSTYALKVAKGAEAAYAIPVHVCILLSSEAVILSIHAKHTEWEEQTAHSIHIGKAITVSAVVRLQYLVREHPMGGIIRSQILSGDKAAMEMPGKGEVVAYAYHLKARILLIIAQVYEDLLGLAESARQRTRVGDAAAAWFKGGLAYADFFELGGAVSPDDEDNMHGGRMGSTDGPTWQADHERACKEQASIGGMVWGDICGAAKMSDRGRYVFNWVSLAQQTGFCTVKTAKNTFSELMVRLNKAVADVRNDERADMFQPLDITASVTKDYLQKARSTEAAEATALKVVEARFAASAKGGGTAGHKRKDASPAPGAGTGAQPGNNPGPNLERNRAKRAEKKAKAASPAGGGTGSGQAEAGSTATTAAAGTGGGKATAGGGGAGGNGGNGGALLAVADIQWNPNVFTCLISRGQGAPGAIEGFEALARARNSKACGWQALLGRCSKANCSRCASGEVANAADVQKVKACAAQGLL